jgi:hypothetical protein
MEMRFGGIDLVLGQHPTRPHLQVTYLVLKNLKCEDVYHNFHEC